MKEVNATEINELLVILSQNLIEMNKAIDEHIAKLSKTIESLMTFKTTKVSTITRIQMLKKEFKCGLNSGNYLYIIKTNFLDHQKILKQFNQFKDKNRETYKLSSINDINEFKGVLYVGSSASLDSRLNEHLGHKGSKIYSLHLKHWFKKISKVEIEIIPIDKTYSDILYPLENALWDFHKPLFGKKGPNVNSSKHI